MKHGQSYRWRARGTPPTVGAAGWSPWCEFTIPEKAPDDLGLDDSRNFRATLTAAEWRQVLAVFADTEDDAAARASIETATKAARHQRPDPLDAGSHGCHSDRT
ncbi:hypothetical protein [Paractinoplanes hotanensis]|uniref:Uncharacterized protein n=1 Tax=Paractinoplanes hotanensis TaxID=2906497 RepID=A0ABT0XYL1_9ACTN|nr:hypothetical protein [Actinoplanes hotanensis]MCM4078807.1 hypothetical protein [Actinoplanes hotanensis]